MDRKKWILIILAVILILIGSFAIYESNFSQKVKVGESYFTIPSEFQKENVSTDLVRFISNDKIFFINSNVNATNIDSAVSNYINYKNQTENMTIEVNKLNVDGIEIHKSIVQDNSSVVHYWFNKNNHNYEIYTPTADPTMDKLIIEIIKS